MDSCKICNESYLTLLDKQSEYYSTSCLNKDRIFTKKHKRNISINRKGKLKGTNNPNWKNGVSEKNIPLYNTYANKIEYAEKVRRNKADKNILEVRCTYCGKWYIPKRSEVQSRINALNGKLDGEYRLYCSDECKLECPIYRKVKYPLGYKKISSREVQPELRQLRFKFDNWTCQECKKKDKQLHCHHIEGIRWEPLESADIDKVITLCKDCHKEVHKKEVCGYNELKCKKEINYG